MKKLLNDPDALVDQSLAGFVRANGARVRADAANRLCLRREAPLAGKVALVSGGGSGHEPLHAGFVGRGMLDAAVLGDVFASPTADQVLAAIDATDAGAGVLLVVKNYTGDLINFREAAGEAGDDGHEVEIVVVDDDVATRGGAGTGGRGTAATVCVEKIAGALAQRGATLEEVAAVARAVIERSRSIGIALEACTTPMAGRPTFELGHDEIEFGVGIHGEAGIERRAHAEASALAEQMLTTLLEGEPLVRGPILVLVNGFGATPAIELYLLYDEVARLLEARGFEVARSLVGNLVTSLDMAGASITLLVLDDRLLELWDAPVATATLNW